MKTFVNKNLIDETTLYDIASRRVNSNFRIKVYCKRNINMLLGVSGLLGLIGAHMINISPFATRFQDRTDARFRTIVNRAWRSGLDKYSYKLGAYTITLYAK